jgi:hypothetical protein
VAVTPEQLEALAVAPQSVSGDSGSFTERSADDVLKLLAAAGQQDLPANANGGRLSGWHGLRPARAVTEGTYPSR